MRWTPRLKLPPVQVIWRPQGCVPVASTFTLSSPAFQIAELALVASAGQEAACAAPANKPNSKDIAAGSKGSFIVDLSVPSS
jgi:hypothetical protein